MSNVEPPIDQDAGPVWMQHMMRAIGTTIGEPAVAWALKQAHIVPPTEPTAEDWEAWGYNIKTPEYGCVVVLENGQVGLFQRQEADTVYLVGHEEGKVAIIPHEEDQVIACRWPAPEDFRDGNYPRDDRDDV